MAAFSGTAGSVVYMTGGTTAVSGIAEWTLDGSMSAVETTAFGEVWDSFVPSVRNATLSFSGNRDDTAAQTSLVSAFLGGSAIALRLYQDTTKYWNVGTAYITGMSPSISIKGKGDISFNCQVSGSVSYV
jgi:hypothetical protein